MPDQLDQPGAPTPEREHGAIERIGGQALLNQHRQSGHPLAHVGYAVGQVEPQTGRQRDHLISQRPQDPAQSAAIDMGDDAHSHTASAVLEILITVNLPIFMLAVSGY